MHHSWCNTRYPQEASAPNLASRLKDRVEDNLMVGYEPDPKIETARFRASIATQLKQAKSNIELLTQLLKTQQARKKRLTELAYKWRRAARYL